jgi:hypothetical protein
METKSIKEFTQFVDREIEPALKDIGKLPVNSRKHLQKLVYTNLVDRFDSTIDQLLLDNCRHGELIIAAESDMKSQVTEAELLKLLMESANLDAAIDNRLKSSIRNTILRLRHSRKLLKLFQVFQPEQRSESFPRVNISTGKVLEKIKPQKNVTCPYSICGYADWLYSRRNSIVHGAGSSSFLKNDRVQLKKLYNREPAKTFKISVGSVQITAVFYKEVAKLLAA